MSRSGIFLFFLQAVEKKNRELSRATSRYTCGLPRVWKTLLCVHGSRVLTVAKAPMSKHSAANLGEQAPVCSRRSPERSAGAEEEARLWI